MTTEAPGEAYRVSMTLRLPRDAVSVPLTRHITHFALAELGVVEGIIADIDVVLSEACANVLEHSGPGDAYDVVVSITGGSCQMSVVDLGRGYQPAPGPPTMPAGDAEKGRGLALMQALMDEVHFSSQPNSRTEVVLMRKLEFDRTVPASAVIGTHHPRDEGSG